MALDFQILPVSFGGGLDTKLDKKQTIPGKLTTLENGVFTKGQRISKRNGYTTTGVTTTAGATLASPQALTTFTPSEGIKELIQVAGNELYSYSSDQDKWIDKDPVESVTLKYKSIYQDYKDCNNCDVATNSGIDVITWTSFVSPTLTGCFAVIDSTTGAQIQLNTSLITGGGYAPAAIGNYIYLFYFKAANSIAWRRIDVSTPQTLSGETVLVTDAASGPMVTVADGFVWLSYNTNVSTLKTIKLDSSAAIQANVSLAVNFSPQAICVSTNVFVYYNDTVSGLSYAVYNSSLTLVLGATVIDAAVGSLGVIASALSSTSQYVFYGKGPVPTTSLDASQAIIYRATVGTAGVTVAFAELVRSVRLQSRAFIVGSNHYFWAAHFSTLQSTNFLIRHDGVAVGKSFYGKKRSQGNTSSVAARSATEFFVPQSIITQYVGIFGVPSGTRGGISSISMDFSGTNAFERGMLGQNLHFGGGYLSAYDGRSVTECGFHLFPEDATGAQSATVGTLADGTYQYRFVYEWIDNMGQVHRSAPSVAISVVIAGGAGLVSADLVIPTLRVTEKRGVAGECAIQIYRTLAGGSIFYNVKSTTATVLFNSTTANSVSYNDGAADATIDDNETLYTTGGVLENIPPESCSIIDVYQSRMVTAGMEDPLQYGYSKVHVRGEGVAFSDSFVSSVDPLGGAITAARLMDDKIILFKGDYIFFVSGEGPNDTGTQNNYSLPQLITSDSGCPYPKSTVLMPLGMMYKSKKGIYLLTRGLQVEYVGADVQDYNSQDITAATLIQDKNQVRFLTSSGYTLVYDYYFKQWSTFTNHTGVDAVNWQNTYSYLRSDNKVYLESAAFTDNGTAIVLKAATAWIKGASIQGFQRVRTISFLGEYKSAHTLTAKIGYNFVDTYTSTFSFNAASVIGSTSANYQFQVSPAIQKCDALRIEISDVPDVGSPGESYNVTDISFEIGLKKGLTTLGSSQKI